MSTATATRPIAYGELLAHWTLRDDLIEGATNRKVPFIHNTDGHCVKRFTPTTTLRHFTREEMEVAFAVSVQEEVAAADENIAAGTPTWKARSTDFCPRCALRKIPDPAAPAKASKEVALTAAQVAANLAVPLPENPWEDEADKAAVEAEIEIDLSEVQADFEATQAETAEAAETVAKPAPAKRVRKPRPSRAHAKTA